MIHLRLVGGLGNQLFQYACARALAVRRGVGVVLDLRELSRGAAHAVYGLHHFAIAARVGELAELPPPREKVLTYGLWRAGLMRPHFLRERGLGVNAAVLTARDGTYLHGYFQSEDYFLDCEAQIRADLTITAAPSEENRLWLDRITADPCAVSLHVRRGDYAGSIRGQAVHGTCDAAYYARATMALREKLGIEPRFYIFSDDPDWARNNLKLGAETVVLDHNPPSAAVEDMRLMGACRHHIIANSSFSWWGAWRNPSATKVVVAPQQWFLDPALVNPDICPKGWLRV